MLTKRYTAREACTLLGISRRTLGRMLEASEIQSVVERNRHYFTDESLSQLQGIGRPSSPRATYLYSRVSSAGQRRDLESQQLMLEQFAASNGYTIAGHLTDIGSGINFKRKRFLELVRLVLDRQVGRVIVSYEDRLTRFGFDFFKEVFSWHGCEIITINSKASSPQQELVEDLMTIIHVFSSRLYGLRRNKEHIHAYCREAEDQSAG